MIFLISHFMLWFCHLNNILLMCSIPHSYQSKISMNTQATSTMKKGHVFIGCVHGCPPIGLSCEIIWATVTDTRPGGPKSTIPLRNGIGNVFPIAAHAAHTDGQIGWKDPVSSSQIWFGILLLCDSVQQIRTLLKSILEYSHCSPFRSISVWFPPTG